MTKILTLSLCLLICVPAAGQDLQPGQIRQMYDRSLELPYPFAFRQYVEDLVSFGVDEGSDTAVHSILDMLAGGHKEHNAIEVSKAIAFYNNLVQSDAAMKDAIAAQEIATICPSDYMRRTGRENARAVDALDDAQESIAASEYESFVAQLDDEDSAAFHAKLDDLKESTIYVKVDHDELYKAHGTDVAAMIDDWCRRISH